MANLIRFCGCAMLVFAASGIAPAAAENKAFGPSSTARLSTAGTAIRLLARRGRRHHGRNHEGEPRPEQHLSHLARRQAGRLRIEGRVPHAQRRICQLGHSDPQLGRAGEMARQRLPARHGRGKHYTGICYGENYRGILAGRGEKAPSARTTRKSSNIRRRQRTRQVHQEARLERVRHHGPRKPDRPEDQRPKMCELIDDDAMARREGIIALQIHAGEPMKAQFRNIRLKEFKSGGAAPAAPASN